MAHEALSSIPSPERDEGGVPTSQIVKHKFNFFSGDTPSCPNMALFLYRAKTLPPLSEAPSAQLRETLIATGTPAYAPRLLELDLEG